ncbi:hypothetical protein D3C71_479900 [compost metagenome]
MVDTVLHTHQVIQRTHSPEVILTESPTYMVDWGVTLPAWNLYITYHVATIDNSDEPISTQLTSGLIVVVPVELKDFHVVSHVVGVHVPKTVCGVPTSLVEVFHGVTPEVETNLLPTLQCGGPEGILRGLNG